MRHIHYFLIFCFFCFASCGTTTDNKDSTAKKPAEKVVAQTSAQLPSITVELMQKLYDKCDYVDYLFYESDFSMSMNNKGSIQQTLTHVSEGVPVLNPNCKSIGRVFYEIEGNTEIEAEIFFSNECQYFVFMKDQKQIYANNITGDGVAHFNNIFEQAKKMAK